jgi:hypothetical protein
VTTLDGDEHGKQRKCFPGRIRQFGFIIPDLDAAITEWVDLGVAPWLVVPDIPMEGCWYRGEPSNPVISTAVSEPAAAWRPVNRF